MVNIDIPNVRFNKDSIDNDRNPLITLGFLPNETFNNCGINIDTQKAVFDNYFKKIKENYPKELADQINLFTISISAFNEITKEESFKNSYG